MNNPLYLKRNVIAASVILGLGIPMAALGKPEDKKLAIFVGGKEYSSFRDYKQSRIEKIKEKASRGKSQAALNKENIITEALDKKLSENKLNSSPRTAAAEAAEIQELFNNILKKHAGQGEPLTLDPSKIKTIQVTPNKSHTINIRHPRLKTGQGESPPSPNTQEGADVPEMIIPK